MTVLPLSWKMGLVTNEGEEFIGRRDEYYAETETDTIAVGLEKETRKMKRLSMEIYCTRMSLIYARPQALERCREAVFVLIQQ